MTRIGRGYARGMYDSSDQNRGMEQYDNNGNGSVVSYVRDVSGRITARFTSTLSNWTVAPTASLYYGYTGNGGSSFTKNANGDIVEKTVQLAGGMMLTIKPQETQTNNQKQYSATSALGNTLFTTDATGTNTATGSGPLGTFAYDPFGNAVASSSLPANTAQGSYGYGGANQKLTESNMTITPIQMGSRVYLPTLGRFTSLDPVIGGTANNYVYTLDPINSNDYSGNSCNAYGCSLSGYMQVTISGSSLQNAASAASVQHAASVGYVQPAASYRRIQSTVFTTTTARVTIRIIVDPKPAPKARDNSTAMKTATVKGMSVTSIGGAPYAPAYYNKGPGEKFDYFNAAGTAAAFGAGGALIGGASGCAYGAIGGAAVGAAVAGIGAVAGAAVGCIANSAIGAAIGGAVASTAGWLIGGYRSAAAGWFDWMPNELYVPW